MKAKIVVGLGYGDEGKGLTVDHLCYNSKSPVVVRFSGGQQAGHTVHRGGVKHTCANFGAGVLLGEATYFSEHTTFYPVTIAREELVLNEKGFFNPKLYFHPMARITTPWDVYENRNCDATLGHGTCGLGVGKTMKRNEGQLQLRAIDLLHKETFNAKLEQIMNNIAPMHDLPMWFAQEIAEFRNAVMDREWNIEGYDWLKQFSTIIFEGSQGIMLDMDHGVFPNVTYSNTTSKNAMAICDHLGIKKRTVYGVTRAYSTRHGLGNGSYEGEPIVLTDTEHETNVTNKYQGKFLVTKMDYERLNHAIRVEKLFSDGYKFNLMVTCCNQTSELENFNTFYVDKEGIDKIYQSYSITGKFSKKQLVHD